MAELRKSLRPLRLLALNALALGLAAACQPAQSMLAPRGPAAERIALLWWVMLVLGSVIWLAVMALAAAGLWQRRHDSRAAAQAPMAALPAPPAAAPELPGGNTRWIVGGGVIMPVIVLTGIYALTVDTMRVAPAPNAAEVVVSVIGHQFWWEVSYPDLDITTANEIHIPTGQTVVFELSSADVIHSFWVPELGGKLDLIPGHTTRLALQADTPGVFRGRCAEFCGVQHARMGLIVVAEPQADFANWAAQQQQPAAEPETALTQAGQDVFLGLACAYCHTIRGTPAEGRLGPDLTHLASRRTLAAANMPNVRGHLAGWILDPQASKPGNRMPPTHLDSAELQALLAYLESLE
jgi:cytochrome c oxidase subunit II